MLRRAYLYRGRRARIKLRSSCYRGTIYFGTVVRFFSGNVDQIYVGLVAPRLRWKDACHSWVANDHLRRRTQTVFSKCGR